MPKIGDRKSIQSSSKVNENKMTSSSSLDPPELSQSEVCWKYQSSTSSPNQNNVKRIKLSSDDSIQTPIRIVKRKLKKSPAPCSPQFEDQQLNTKDSFSLSSDEFKYDLEEDELLAAAQKLIETRAYSEKVKSDLLKSTNRSVGLLDDSLDDDMLSSIPLDDIRKQCYSKDKPILDQVTNKKEFKISSSSFSRHASEPSVQLSMITYKRTEVGNKTSKFFGRHNSLPTTPKTVKDLPQKDYFAVGSPSEVYGDKNLISGFYKGFIYIFVGRIADPAKVKPICTAAEIAEKKRLALQRLEITRQAVKQKERLSKKLK